MFCARLARRPPHPRHEVEHRGMSDRHPIRNGVVSTVIGGLILTLLSAVWPPAQHVAAYVLGLLSSPVPAWTLPVLALIAAALTAFLSRRKGVRLPLPISTPNAPSAPSPLPTAPSAPQRTMEKDILQVLVKADGGPVEFDDFVSATGAVRLRVQAELEALMSKKVVELWDEVESGVTHAYLTERGRQYAIKLGLL